MVYQQGEEVLRDQPFSYVVRVNVRSSVCDFCLKEAKTSVKYKNCSACKTVYYCNSKCQRNSWNSHHQSECVYLRKAPPIVLRSEAVLLMIRIILKLQKEGDHEFFAELPDGRKRYFRDLISHKKDIENDVDSMDTFQSMFSLIKASLMGNIPSQDDVMEIYGKMMVNAFNIVNGVIENIGYGLYLGTSVLDHSCAPNAHWHFRGKDMIIRSIEKVNDFSELRHSYLQNLTASTKIRREKLLQDHYFLCECSNCQDVTKDQMKSSLLCPNCNRGCSPLGTGKCIDCHHVIDSSEIEKYKSLKRQLVKAVACQSDQFDELFNKAITIFHPFDVKFMDFLDFYAPNEYQSKNYSRCLEISKMKLAHLYQHVPEFEMHIGSEEILAADLCCHLGFLDESEEHIEKAKNILSVVFGEDHPILDKKWKPIRLQIDQKKPKSIV